MKNYNHLTLTDRCTIETKILQTSKTKSEDFLYNCLTRQTFSFFIWQTYKFFVKAAPSKLIGQCGFKEKYEKPKLECC